MPSWAWVVTRFFFQHVLFLGVSMPSWAWVVTRLWDSSRQVFYEFQCPHGLELLLFQWRVPLLAYAVSMPSWAWVVTARMSNILNFSWYFLCIPAIYKCILAYLPIFFNQLSKFLRCESPSTFLGTCLSHHSFIIFLVTNTNTLLSGLYLISTNRSAIEDRRRENCVNALSGLYLISTVPLQKPRFYAVSRACFCRYLSEYSDSSRFSCMLTFWTYLMRCTYPWHWI